MCGRFILRTPSDALRKLFRLMHNETELVARYNIAPTQPVAAVREIQGERELSLFHWGLIPPWSKDSSFSSRMINARSESLTEKPAFKNAYQRRRCLIPADGFYEWKQSGKQKHPYFIHAADDRLLAMAGLWERWNDIESCSIITTSANSVMQQLHHRMPVIISEENFDCWLSGNTDLNQLQQVLATPISTKLAYHAVSTQVNSPRYDAPNCIQEVKTRNLFDE